MIDPHLLFILNEIDDEEEKQELRVNRRFLRDISDPFTLPEHVFKGVYRLSRECALDLIEEISPHLIIQREEIAIPKMHRVLITLHLLAQGSYQKCVGQDFFVPMAQQTLSVCLKQVTTAIVDYLSHIIEFPITEEAQNAVKQGFMEKGAFPRIVGAIDCTHVAIQAPPFEDPDMPGIVFLNRKGYYSLNTQIVVDSELKILAVNARFPGSVHDSAIWSTSEVKLFLERSYREGNTNSWLIGDSGYPLQPFLMTPVSGHNLNQSEINFNVIHKAARNVIERLNGVLKARFRCCLGHRTLHYKPEMAANIIYTCCILHNICLNRGIEEIPDIAEINEHDPDIVVEHDNIQFNWLNEGRIARQRIINNFIN